MDTIGTKLELKETKVVGEVISRNLDTRMVTILWNGSKIQLSSLALSLFFKDASMLKQIKADVKKEVVKTIEKAKIKE